LAALLGLTLFVYAIPPARAEPPRAGYAPDPIGKPSTKQWVFEITHRKGKLTIDRVRSATASQPIPTPRMTGRFALELYIGKELLDRVRFNVPLMGDGPLERSRSPFARPTFEDVTARVQVQMADNPRATYALLVDRATGEVVPFEWPPEPDGRLVPRKASTAGAAPGKASPGGTTAAGDKQPASEKEAPKAQGSEPAKANEAPKNEPAKADKAPKNEPAKANEAPKTQESKPAKTGEAPRAKESKPAKASEAPKPQDPGAAAEPKEGRAR
jgi:hypothetical protein